MVLLQKKRRRRGDINKLQQKFVEVYQVFEAYISYTYKIERQVQSSMQNEVQFKLHYLCIENQGKAPTSWQLRFWPNRKRSFRPRPKKDMSNFIALHLELVQLSELSDVVPLEPEPRANTSAAK